MVDFEQVNVSREDTMKFKTLPTESHPTCMLHGVSFHQILEEDLDIFTLILKGEADKNSNLGGT